MLCLASVQRSLIQHRRARGIYPMGGCRLGQPGSQGRRGREICWHDERTFQAGRASVWVSVFDHFTSEKWDIANVPVYTRWASELPNRLPRQGFEIIQAGNTKFKHDLVQLCTTTYLMALTEILRGIEWNSAVDGAILVRKHDEALYGLLQETRNGMVYNWIPITVLGKKKE